MPVSHYRYSFNFDFLYIFRFFCTLPVSFQNNAMNHEYFSTKQLNGNLITFLQARAWFDFYLLPFIHFSVTFQMSACLECLHIFFFHENFSNSTQDTHLFLFLIKLHAIHPLVSRLLVKINIFTFAFTFTSVFTGFDNVPTKFIYKINSKLKLKFSWIWTSQKIWSHTLPTKFISLWTFKHCSLLLIFTFWKGKLFRILCYYSSKSMKIN